MTTVHEDIDAHLLDGATVLHIQPSDVLLIGNVGLITHDAADRMYKHMTETLGVKRVYLFEHDINVTLLRDTETIRGGNNKTSTNPQTKGMA